MCPCQSMPTLNLSRGLHIHMMAMMVSVCVWVCAHECRCLQKPEEDARSPGDGVTGYCEPPTMDAGNRSPGLCKNSKHTSVLRVSPASHPVFYFNHTHIGPLLSYLAPIPWDRIHPEAGKMEGGEVVLKMGQRETQEQ